MKRCTCSAKCKKQLPDFGKRRIHPVCMRKRRHQERADRYISRAQRKPTRISA